MEGIAFLLSVSFPIGMLMVFCLSNTTGTGKGRTNLFQALMKQVNSYKAFGVAISHVLVDGEGGFAKVESQLNQQGVVLHPAAGEHMVRAKNKGRQVKERVRAHRTTLSFRLFPLLLIYLVYFCVSRINLVPQTTQMSFVDPREMLTDEKLDANANLRVAFGEYVQAHT